MNNQVNISNPNRVPIIIVSFLLITLLIIGTFLYLNSNNGKPSGPVSGGGGAASVVEDN